MFEGNARRGALTMYVGNLVTVSILHTQPLTLDHQYTGILLDNKRYISRLQFYDYNRLF
jgi:hypothetical protein